MCARDIISNQETLEFLNAYFPENNISGDPIPLLEFVSTIIKVYTELFEEFSDENQKIKDDFLQEFLLIIQDQFTTKNSQYLSLNALEIQTKSQGLY